MAKDPQWQATVTFGDGGTVGPIQSNDEQEARIAAFILQMYGGGALDMAAKARTLLIERLPNEENPDDFENLLQWQATLTLADGTTYGPKTSDDLTEHRIAELIRAQGGDNAVTMAGRAMSLLIERIA